MREAAAAAEAHGALDHARDVHLDARARRVDRERVVAVDELHRLGEPYRQLFLEPGLGLRCVEAADVDAGDDDALRDPVGVRVVPLVRRSPAGRHGQATHGEHEAPGDKKTTPHAERFTPRARWSAIPR